MAAKKKEEMKNEDHDGVKDKIVVVVHDNEGFVPETDAVVVLVTEGKKKEEVKKKRNRDEKSDLEDHKKRRIKKYPNYASLISLARCVYLRPLFTYVHATISALVCLSVYLCVPLMCTCLSFYSL